MVERITIEQYREMTGKKPAKRSGRKVKRENDLAMVTLISELERQGYKFGGVWRNGMKVENSTVYLEFPFSKERRFRADLSIPSERLLLEVHGGSYVVRKSKDGTTQHIGGAHHSPAGRKRDMEKARLANIEGWCYLEVDWGDMKDGTALNDIQSAIKGGRYETDG